MTSPALRARYLNDTVATASPARLLVMLYERLALDLAQAETALRAGDRDSAAPCLLHAQDIVIELHNGLDLTAWSGAAGLAQLYTWLSSQMVAANVSKDAETVAGCRRLVEPLRDAWHEAARQIGASA